MGLEFRNGDEFERTDERIDEIGYSNNSSNNQDEDQSKTVLPEPYQTMLKNASDLMEKETNECIGQIREIGDKALADMGALISQMEKNQEEIEKISKQIEELRNNVPPKEYYTALNALYDFEDEKERKHRERIDAIREKYDNNSGPKLR